VNPPKRVGIIGKEKAPALELAAQLVGWLQSRHIDVVVDKELAALAGLPPGVTRSQIPSQVDLILVLGGDGTLLSVARLVGSRGTPVLGINLGSLGFLTEVSIDELYPSLEKVLAGEGTIEPRMMLTAHVHRREERIAEYHILNDVVINKGALSRIIELETMVNDQKVTTYRADGLIVSSPTGSTAYNLSAGGPMIHPGMECMVLTPICPFTLTNRSIVLPANADLKITLSSETGDCFLTVDGQVGLGIQYGDRIEVRRAAFDFMLVRSLTRSYYEIARAKLKWNS
jgi:NAD+ kinase